MKAQIEHRDIAEDRFNEESVQNREVSAKLRNPLAGISKEQMFADVDA